MKFGKKYSEYIEREGQSHLPGCSYVEFKRLKKLLKRCPLHYPFDSAVSTASCSVVSSPTSACTFPNSLGVRNSQKNESLALAPTERSASCTVCDGNFFGVLMEELAAVVGCFNTRAQRLLQLHLASGFRKHLLRLKWRVPNEIGMIQEGQTLVSYASMNAIAVRKILKKYDKVHRSKEGGVFRGRLLAMRGALLQSPWLIELTALHLNLADAKAALCKVPEGFGEFSCNLEGAKPTLSCTVLDSANLDFDLTCPICLEMVFVPTALACGHVFCNSCVCLAASVPAFEGPKAALYSSKCPLCRQAGMYADAIRLKELAVLISNRCKDYWEERLLKERKEQLQEAKEYWDKHLQALMGI